MFTMPITLSPDDYWYLLCHQILPTFTPESEGEDIWQPCPQFAQGYCRDIQLRPGVELSITEGHLLEDTVLNLPERSHPVEFSYVVTGSEISNLGAISAGQYVVCSSGVALAESLQVSAHQPSQTVSIHIEPAIFQIWLTEHTPNLLHHSSSLQNLLKPDSQPYITQVYSITPAMQMVLRQIVGYPFQGGVKQLYLESKIWELVILYLASLDVATSTSTPLSQLRQVKPLTPEDTERIYYARDILITRLADPPSLIELARLTRINDCKLKFGFKQVFGTTVFGYLHRYRMEQARHLLNSESLTIAQVAHRVGFMNCSHFALAFRKQYGVNPNHYRRYGSIQGLV
jgi:AraC-like DNA-binding protein